MTTTSLQQNTIQSTHSEIAISSKKVWTDIELAIVFLAILSLAGQSIKYLTVYDEAFGLIPLVNMGKALSIPTIFFVLLYFIAFILLLMISAAKTAGKDRFRRHWCGLAALSLYLAFDKGTALHTYVFKQIRTWVNGFMTFFPYHRWVFSLGIALIILVLFYLKFIAALPKETRVLAFIALATYYTGFLLIERFGEDFAAIYGVDSLIHSTLQTLGRTLQMSGLAAAIFTLLDYFEMTLSNLSLDL